MDNNKGSLVYSWEIRSTSCRRLQMVLLQHNPAIPDSISLESMKVCFLFACSFSRFWSFVGFLEGRRVQDGQRGWFSTACVVEITNEHVQRRHLRQRYHVLQTATRLLKQRSGVLELPTTKCFI